MFDGGPDMVNRMVVLSNQLLVNAQTNKYLLPVEKYNI